jgi:hypothetical protein
MTSVQTIALALTVAWLLIVAVRFRRSTPVLVGGLVLVSGHAAWAMASGASALTEFGAALPQSWLTTFAFAVGWTALMFAYSPVADWIASRFVAKPPTLQAFRAIQEGMLKLIGGIALAWVLGGVLEELVFRGVVVTAVDAALVPMLGQPVAAAIAVVLAALGAGIAHWYQGPRAMIIITQLSVLFGVLYVVSGYNLYAVILCHGFYDTIAFIRFAMRKSKYSNLDDGAATPA